MLGQKDITRIKNALMNLQEDPFRSRPGANIKKLHVSIDPPLFRLRTGNYRAIYFVIDNEVKVTEIIHRSKGYKWLE